VAHDYGHTEAERATGFGPGEGERDQIGLDLEATDSEEGGYDEDAVPADSRSPRDNRMDRARSDPGGCSRDSKASCREDIRGACRPERQEEEEEEEGSRKDALRVERKNMATQSLVLASPVECWMHH